MSLFGSVVRDDFEPERSDVDVLVEFLPQGAHRATASSIARDALESLLGRKVDLVTKVGKYIRPFVQQDLSTIYEQA